MSETVVICHSSLTVVDSLAAALRGRFPNASIISADNLTKAYDLAEHKEPQYILIEARLAATRDFELLQSLMKILKIKCWAVGEKQRAVQRSEIGQIPYISEAATSSDIADAMAVPSHVSAPTGPPSPVAHDPNMFRRGSIIMIGASTGGVDALTKVLAHFSPKSPPVLLVQHTGGSFTKSLIRLLDSVTDAHVRAAVDGESPLPGHVYLAPDDTRHLCLAGRTSPRIVLTGEGLLSGHRPSIDALFQSARPFAPQVAAALLTGMGQDGARGLLMLRQAGVRTIAQDAATSVVYGMPRVAMEMGAVTQQLPIHKIGPALLAACASNVRA